MKPEREPDARVMFEKGDYGHAISCYHEAKEWTLANGMCFASGVAGIIQSPTFRGQKANGIIPSDWDTNEKSWQTQICIWLDGPAGLAWLRGVKPPDNATIEIYGTTKQSR